MVKTFFNFLDKAFLKLTNVPPVAILLIIATMIVLPVPFKYLFLKPELYTNTPFASSAFTLPIVNNILFVFHIAAAVPAIIFGPFLFITSLRKAYPKWHIVLGQFYVVGCILSALTVVPLAMNNNPETPAPIGFTVMAFLWFTTTYFAYTAAIHKDYVAHRRWIMRSYAMTVAFIHVNLTWHLIGIYDTMDANGIKVMQSMVSWLANLMIVEIYLAGTAFTGRYLGSKKWLKNATRISKDDRFHMNFRRPPSPKKL